MQRIFNISIFINKRLKKKISGNIKLIEYNIDLIFLFFLIKYF